MAPPVAPPVVTATTNIEAHRAEITAFCGDCHALPKPSSFPQEAWYEEVERGFQFYYASGRSDLHPPAKNDVVEFFREPDAQLGFISGWLTMGMILSLPLIAIGLWLLARSRR